jgi:hypothetical protein
LGELFQSFLKVFFVTTFTFLPINSFQIQTTQTILWINTSTGLINHRVPTYHIVTILFQDIL